MTGNDRQIPQRELRNNVGSVLREVEAGVTVRVTVRGRPVADLVPVDARPAHLTRAQLERVLREAPLDGAFAADVEAASGATIDEL